MVALDAGALFAANPTEPMTIGPVKQTEVLARAAQENRDQQMLADLQALRVETTALPDDAGLRLARLRAHTSAKMADCCVLLTPERQFARGGTPVATPVRRPPAGG